MVNSLILNSYHVLGLPVTVSQKEILKRAKELQSLLKIDEVPVYDEDFLEAKKIRNEETVKVALQNLTATRKRIKEYFFWFKINDAIDEEACNLLKSKDYGAAISIWKAASAKTGSRAYFYKKNLAILYCLLLTNHSIRQSNYLKSSLELWKELIESDRFWTVFLQTFKEQDDLNTNSETITEFRNHVTPYLADIYTEISQIHKEPSFFSEFSDMFGVKGERAKSDIVNPIYNNIQAEVAKLDKINIIENKLTVDQALSILKETVQSIQEEFNKLIDLGIFEDSETKTLRDRVANSIRSVVLDLYNNNLEKGEKTLALLNIAHKISGSVGTQHKVQEDINILKNNQKYNKILEPLTELVQQQKYQEALDMIEDNLTSENKDLEQVLKSQKKIVITLYAFEKNKAGHTLLDKKRYTEAQNSFADAGDLVYQNLELFDRLNLEGVKNILKQINEMVAVAKKKDLANIDVYRANLLKGIDENIGENDIERSTLKGLIDSYLWAGLMPLFRRVQHNNEVAKVFYTIGWITIWFYGIGLIAFVIGAVYSNMD